VTVEDSDTEIRKTEEKLEDDSGKKNNYDEGQNWRKVKEGVPIKNVPYPHAPSTTEAERQFIRFTKILKNILTFLLLRHYSKCLLMLVL